MTDSAPVHGEAGVAEPGSARRSFDAGMCCPRCEAQAPEGAAFCPFDGTSLDHQLPRTTQRDSLVGMIVDERYEVLQLLGEGGMGCVYRVRHRVLGRLFALKALRPELSCDWVTAARFVQEARAMAAISHPNIVSISDFGLLPSGQPYFVMELLEGRTLSSLLYERGALSTVEVLLFARQVAMALRAAHEAGVIHRDLKPDNVVILDAPNATFRLKVLDFGLAMVGGAHRLTLDGVVFGTPQYMSPEQASGEPLDARVDVYALGIVLYEAWTGRAPFEADTYMGVLTKQLYAEPRPPSEVLELSESERHLEATILRCLSKAREERYTTMSELLVEIEGLLGVLSPLELTDSVRQRMPSIRPPMASVVRRYRRRTRLVTYAVVGTVALILALLALYLRLSSASAAAAEVPPPLPAPRVSAVQ